MGAGQREKLATATTSSSSSPRQISANSPRQISANPMPPHRSGEAAPPAPFPLPQIASPRLQTHSELLPVGSPGAATRAVTQASEKVSSALSASAGDNGAATAAPQDLAAMLRAVQAVLELDILIGQSYSSAWMRDVRLTSSWRLS